jgi:hypothetical protein
VIGYGGIHEASIPPAIRILAKALAAAIPGGEVASL